MNTPTRNRRWSAVVAGTALASLFAFGTLTAAASDGDGAQSFTRNQAQYGPIYAPPQPYYYAPYPTYNAPTYYGPAYYARGTTRPTVVMMAPAAPGYVTYGTYDADDGRPTSYSSPSLPGSSQAPDEDGPSAPKGQ